MENLIFTAKKRPKPVSINETAVMRVSAETYNTLRELHSLTGLPMIQILQKITAYAIENMVILEPDMNAEEPDLQKGGDELDRILQIAETLERTLEKLCEERHPSGREGQKAEDERRGETWINIRKCSWNWKIRRSKSRKRRSKSKMQDG